MSSLSDVCGRRRVGGRGERKVEEREGEREGEREREREKDRGR